MRVVLLVTNPYRDLPDRVLTAASLCQQGITCYLLPSLLRRREIWALTPDLVLLDNLRTGNESLVRRFQAAGIRIVVLDTEGAVFTSIDRYADKLARNAAVRGAVSKFCCWGPALARHAVSAGWYAESQVVITGTPRLDYYVEPWREAALEFSRYADDYGNPMVLINGNFNRSNPWMRPAARAMTDYLGTAYDPDTARHWLETEGRTRQELVELARRLAREFPAVTFVYRPHPFEEAETYQGQNEGCPNLHFVKRGPVQGWILRCCAVIHCGSSTAVEAALAGRPAFSPSWISTPAHYPVVDAVTLECATEEELRQRLQQALRHDPALLDPVRERLEGVLQEWFSSADGHAHERVTSAILSALAEPGPTVSRRRCEDSLDNLDNPAAGLRPRIHAVARRILGLPADWSFRRWRPNSAGQPARTYFDENDINEILKSLELPLRTYYGSAARRTVSARSAQQLGHHHFGYSNGSAVAVSPMEPGP
jgi:surface carbohydrate biosynthesis protein